MGDTATGRFDVIVLGAGPAGEAAAGRTAKAGLSTAIVERELAGGECSYWACIPSKTLLRPEAVLAAARRVPGAREAVTSGIDPSAVFARRDEAVSHWDDTGQADWLSNAGVALFRGSGRLDGARRVVIRSTGGEIALEADRAVVVATGSRPVIPPIAGLDDIEPWDSRRATSASAVPRRLAVLGGGVVAVEMAQAWKSLGSEEVTVIVRGDRLLEREEPFASEALAHAFAETGIDVRLDSGIESVRRLEAAAEVSLADSSVVTVDELLVATGRRPNTEGIGVESLGLQPGKPITVDDRLQAVDVEGSWLYAIGDVNGRAPLTHMGKYQARLCADAIAGATVEAWSDHHAIPSVTFTDPQVASVGARLATARESGLDVREITVPLSSASGAYVNGDQQGMAQLVVDETRHVVIGATFVGPEVAELLHSATIAIAGEVPLERLWHAVPSFPTVSEVWLRLLEAYGL